LVLKHYCSQGGEKAIYKAGLIDNSMRTDGKLRMQMMYAFLRPEGQVTITKKGKKERERERQ